jgi:quercetin dioxygenase-like cupin family protein
LDKLKNIAFSKVLQLGSLVDYHEGQVVSRTLAQNSAVSVTLFSFDAGEEISSHKSDGDAMVTIIEGSARITIGDDTYSLSAGKPL